MYLELLQFVPLDVGHQLHRACFEEPNVVLAWGIWCTAAENGLLEAYEAAGGPCPQVDRLHFLVGARLFFENDWLVGVPLVGFTGQLWLTLLTVLTASTL